MRIAFAIERLDPRLGGVEQWSWQFLQRLIRLGHEVHVVTTQSTSEAKAAGVIQHLVEPSRSRLRLAASFESELRRIRADVIHDTGAGWYCDVFQPHGGSRTSSFEHNLLLEPRWRRSIKGRIAPLLPRYREFERLIERQYGGRDRVYLALSQMVARDFDRFHQVPSEQVRLVYNGVDLERFTPLLRPYCREGLRDRLGIRDEVMIFIAAHNFELKGVPTAIRAVGQLVREGWPVRLVVAGGKRLMKYLRLAVKAGAGEAVSFLGPTNDMASWYAAADVYVQPTFYDPCSLVVLEALASGLPVITSRFNGAGELITDGVEGCFVNNPADASELATQLRPLLDDNRRQQMGAAARRLAENHSLDRNCNEILAVYEEFAGLGRKAA